MKTHCSHPRFAHLLACALFVTASAEGGSALYAQTAKSVAALPAATNLPPTDTPVIGLDPRLTTISRGERQKSKIFVTRKSGGALSDVTVNYVLSGSAVNGQDYALLTDSVVIPATLNRAAVKISPLASGVNGKVKLVLKSGQGYTVDAATRKVKVSIIN